MSQTLVIELSDELYAAVRRRAEAVGRSPADLAGAALEQQFGAPPVAVNGAHEAEKQAARERFERYFGAVDLGDPISVDDE